jgi:hypothetical protein
MRERERLEKGFEAARRLERHMEEIATNVATKDTMDHFMKAGAEMMQAANDMMKQMRVPEGSMNRIHKAQKEVLLAVRSSIDVVLKEIDKDLEEHHPKTTLKKIEVKRKAK